MNTLTSAGHILHHEMKKTAKAMHETIHTVNRPYDADGIVAHHVDANARILADYIDRYFVDEAIAELRRIAARQADVRVRDLRRSILGTEYGGALCGDTIRVRPPLSLGMAGPAASTRPQEAS